MQTHESHPRPYATVSRLLVFCAVSLLTIFPARVARAQFTAATTTIQTYLTGNTSSIQTGTGNSVNTSSSASVDDPRQYYGSGHYFASSRASMGTMGAFVSASGTDIYSTIAELHADAGFSDTVIASATKDYNVTYQLFGSVERSYVSDPGYADWRVGGNVEIFDQTSGAYLNWFPAIPGDTTVAYHASQLFHVNAGDTVFFRASLSLTGILRPNDHPASLTADFGHTAHLYLDATTPGATFIGASGHDYSSPSPIPEPAFCQIGTLLILGGLGIGKLRTKQK